MQNAKLLKHAVIANQSADWCGNPLLLSGNTDSHVELRSPRNDIFSYSPMDCMTLFRAVFMGSLSGSFAEGLPSQSHS